MVSIDDRFFQEPETPKINLRNSRRILRVKVTKEIPTYFGPVNYTLTLEQREGRIVQDESICFDDRRESQSNYLRIIGRRDANGEWYFDQKDPWDNSWIPVTKEQLREYSRVGEHTLERV